MAFDTGRDPDPQYEHTLTISIRNSGTSVTKENVPHGWLAGGTAFIDMQFSRCVSENNVAEPVLDPGTGDPVLLPDGSAVTEAADGIRTKGVEVEIAGRLTSELQASLGWTYYDIRDDQGQRARTFIPRTLCACSQLGNQGESSST